MRFSFHIFVTFNIVHKKLFVRNFVEIGMLKVTICIFKNFPFFLSFYVYFKATKIFFPVGFDYKKAGRFKSTCAFCKTEFSRNRTHFTWTFHWNVSIRSKDMKISVLTFFIIFFLLSHIFLLLQTNQYRQHISFDFSIF